MKRLQGGCSCGAIRYRLLAKPMIVHCCHCNNCQRQTGTAFVLNAVIEAANVKLLKGKPVAVEVPRDHAPHDIYRCKKCGIAVWSDYGRRKTLVFIRVGTLDEARKLKPDVHIFTKAKLPWVKLPDNVPSFKEFYNPKTFWSKANQKRYRAAVGKK